MSLNIKQGKIQKCVFYFEQTIHNKYQDQYEIFLEIFNFDENQIQEALFTSMKMWNYLMFYKIMRMHL